MHNILRVSMEVPLSSKDDSNMNVDRVHGFCEGVAVTVGIAALGFIIIKEIDEFAQRHQRRRAAEGFERMGGISRNMTRPNTDEFTITSGGPLPLDEILEMMGRAMNQPMPDGSSPWDEGTGESAQGTAGAEDAADEPAS